MLSKYVKPGQKVDLEQTSDYRQQAPDEDKKVYYSKVYDILSEDRLEIFMPMEKTKLVLLQVDGLYDLCFYGENGLYQCYARVIDRYKKENAYIVLLELTSELRRFQRREYYRFSCALELRSRVLEKEERKGLEARKENFFVENLPLDKSVIVDISGGGLRFISGKSYEAGDLIYCNYALAGEEKEKTYHLFGKVLSVSELENRKGVYEHRVKYVNMNMGVREEIIRYIFEQERKNRKKEMGV